MRAYWTDGERTLYHGDGTGLLVAWDSMLTDPPVGVHGKLPYLQPASIMTNVMVLATEPTPDAITIWRRPTATVDGSGWDALCHYGPHAVQTPRAVDDQEMRHTAHPAERGVLLWAAALSLLPGIVFDPFAGSGVTLVAARQLGRRAIACEIDERWCDVIVKRLES